MQGALTLGSALARDGEIVGRGHNRRVQRDSAILHGEMDALENAGRLSAEQYQRATIYTTLSPCHMCSGAILLYKIPRVVIAENKTFLGAETLLRQHGVQLSYDSEAEPVCIELMRDFIVEKPELWNEDIGV